MKYWVSHLPLEVWVDVFSFPWISRVAMGRIVDKIGNHQFAEYMQFYLHDWSKHSLHHVCFHQYGMNVFVPYRPYFHYPDIPLAPMPDNIKSFKHISIHHFTAQTIAFLCTIGPLLTNVNLEISDIPPNNMANLRTILANLLPLLNGTHSLLLDLCALPTVEQCFADKLAKIKQLTILYLEGEPMDGAFRQTTVNLLVDWLNSSEQTGPKWCEAVINNGNAFGQQLSLAILEQFFAAKSPSTFVVILRIDGWEFVEFHINNSIGEELHGVQNEHGDVRITRHPANRSAELQEWVKGNQAESQQGRQIDIYRPTIGLLDAIDGPKDMDEYQKPSTPKEG